MLGLLEIMLQIGNHMRANIIISFSLLVTILSCSTEEKEKKYVVSFRNSSESAVTIKGYNTNSGVLVSEINLLPENVGGQIIYFSPSFGGYINGSDSLVFKFQNDRGYICTVYGEQSLCFDEITPLFGVESYFNNLGNNTFEFEITQEDFENVFELPED